MKGLWAFLLLVLVTSPARAGDAALAEKLFNQGLALMDEGKTAEACDKFAASMKAEPSGGAALNYARCNEEMGKTATAWAEYKRAASLFATVRDREREAFALDRAEKLESSLSKLTIEAADTPGLAVMRDGETVPRGALGSAMSVDPGEHTIEARAEGRKPWSTTVTIGKSGDARTVRIPELDRIEAGGAPEPVAPAPEEPAPDPLVVAGGVVLGLGATALIAGAAVGGLVLADAGDAEGDPELCPDKRCTADGRAVINGAEDKALAANVLLGVGGAAVVGGIVMVVVGMMGEEEPAAARVLPAVSPWGGGVQLSAPF